MSSFGGAGAYLAKRIISSRVIAFDDLGPEAVHRIDVIDFPAVVVNDMYGGDLYETSIDTDEDFSEFKDELRKRLEQHTVRNLDCEGYRRSAVKMLFMNKDNEPHVLLTRRSYNVSTHKGHISFPGGGYDETDESILSTAYRETYEEVGIPFEAIDYIGQFDDYLSHLWPSCKLFRGGHRLSMQLQLQRMEVEDYVEAPLKMFVNLDYEWKEEVQQHGRLLTVYHYVYKGYEIWGLTARILTDFSRKIIACCDSMSKK